MGLVRENIYLRKTASPPSYREASKKQKVWEFSSIAIFLKRCRKSFHNFHDTYEVLCDVS